MLFLVLKALHIFFVVCWFAGLFYLPRILVNIAESDNPDTRAHLAQMARRLYRFVTPFMHILIVLGIGLILTNPGYYLRAPWLWVKLALVLFLIGYHQQCGRYVKAVLADTDNHSPRFYRFFNEVPVLFLLAIVLLVVLKPF